MEPEESKSRGGRPLCLRRPIYGHDAPLTCRPSGPPSMSVVYPATRPSDLCDLIGPRELVLWLMSLGFTLTASSLGLRPLFQISTL
jgi:hypothetical protein